MFDFSWGELVVIGAVALIVIGPKELPTVLRAIGQWTTKIRRMASEFQGQFQEAMREAEMADLKRELDTATEGFGSHFDDPEVNKWEPKPDSRTTFEQAASATVPVGPAPTSEATVDGDGAPPASAAPAAPPATEVTAHPDQAPPTAEPAPSAASTPAAQPASPVRPSATVPAQHAAPAPPSAAAPTEPASPAPLVTEGSDRA
jgi:sec-independent protein translocase protein TatB